jgi:DNA-binding NarL/FixJ family response regulator
VPTLALLRRLARAAAAARMLVLVLFRETDAAAAPELAALVAELHRLDGVALLELGGLEADEIVALLEQQAPALAAGGADAAARSLLELTRGNPFLVGELSRHLAEQAVAGRAPAPDAVGVPQSVRDVVAQRLAALSEAARDILELVAVNPRGVALGVLGAAAGLEQDELLAAIDETTGARILEERPEPGLGYAFRHELLRRAVADRLSRARRAALHLRVGTALEAAHGPDDPRVADDLALHFAAAAELGVRERAVRYTLAAADVAMRSLAFAEAAERVGAALELGIGDPADRSRALAQLGTALHRAGRAPQALEAYADAATAARAAGDAALFAAAAIGFENACWRPGIDDPRAVGLLEEAITRADMRDGTRRARLLASLSRALAYRGDHAGAVGRWRRAVTLARRAADRDSLAVTLFHAAWTRGARSPAAVLESMSEARELAESRADPELLHEIEGFRLSLLLETFDIVTFRRELAAFQRGIERTAQPFYRHVLAYMTSTLALCDGRLDDAELAAERAYELSRSFDEDAGAIHGIQMFGIRRERGRLGELAGVVRAVAAGGDGVWTPALVVLLAELGIEDEARARLAELTADDLARVPRGGLWLGGLAYLADACALLGDRVPASALYGELLRLSGRNVVIGQGVACYGAADRFLGALAAIAGDAAAAERHFEAALVLNGRLGSPTWLAHTRYEYARMLLRRDGPGDSARAHGLLEEARRSAAAAGMEALATRIGALLPGADDALPDDLSAREAQVLELVARGLSNREIGTALTISAHTVANHVRSILAKTGCANRTEAASYAHQHRLARRPRAASSRTESPWPST